MSDGTGRSWWKGTIPVVLLGLWILYIGAYGLLRWSGYFELEYEFSAGISVLIDDTGRPITPPQNVLVVPAHRGGFADLVAGAFLPLSAVEERIREAR